MGYPGDFLYNGYYGTGLGNYGYNNMAGSGLYVTDTGGAGNGDASNAEQMRESLENAKTSNTLYYQFREKSRAYRAQQLARKRVSPDVTAKAALDDIPRGLGSHELDRTTGKITWPFPLANDEYSNLRSDLEEQFHLRSQGDHPEGVMIIKQKIKLMVDILRTQIEDMPVAEYMVARKFLTSLDYATHQSVSR